MHTTRTPISIDFLLPGAIKKKLLFIFLPEDGVLLLLFLKGESITIEDAREMIKEVDRDGDGKLVFEEFKNLYNQRYKP